MAELSGIAWTHATFNPWLGCARVSPGCTFCYAERDRAVAAASKRVGFPLWGTEAVRVRTSPDYWRGPIRWNKAAAAAGERRRVFCASLADVFEGRSDLDQPREDLFKLIEATPNLDWLLLTKRPELALKLLPFTWVLRKKTPPNVRIGATVEDQPRAEQRLPHLLELRARLGIEVFVSGEPLLGALDLREWLWVGDEAPVPTRQISWVILGGESGPRARPCDVAWIRGAMGQCRAAGVPVFVKQLGAFPHSDSAGAGWATKWAGGDEGEVSRWRWDEEREGQILAVHEQRDRKGGDPAEWPEDLRVREFPEVTRVA